MPWNQILVLISIAGLGIATYTDLKQRMVRNWLTYSLIAGGLAGNLVLAIIESRPEIFILSAIATVFGFGFAYLLWKMGVWAGGDVKLFTGLAALNPVAPLAFGWISLFPIALFVFSIFAVLPYGIIIALHGLMKRNEERKKVIKDSAVKVKQTIQIGLAIVGLSWILGMFNIPALAIIPILIVFGMIKNAKAMWAIATLLFAASAFNAPIASITNFVVIFALFFGFYLFIKLYTVSKIILREEKKISELEEGDIPVESIIELDGNVKRVAPLEIKTIINYLANNKVQELLQLLQSKGRVIANNKRARGLTDEEIEELNGLVKSKKLSNLLQVKLSAPFVPALLIAYITLYLIGDFVWALVL